MKLEYLINYISLVGEIMVGTKVKHATLGSGVITAFERMTAFEGNSIITVEFATETSRFIYPSDFLENIIKAEDESVHKNILETIRAEFIEQRTKELWELLEKIANEPPLKPEEMIIE